MLPRAAGLTTCRAIDIRRHKGICEIAPSASRAADAARSGGDMRRRVMIPSRARKGPTAVAAEQPKVIDAKAAAASAPWNRDIVRTAAIIVRV